MSASSPQSTVSIRDQRRSALIIALVILVTAGVARLLTYERFLPVVDYSDEAVYVTLADEMRGFSDQSGLRATYGSLAPLYIHINVLVQTVHDVFKPHDWHLPGEYFNSLRLLSVAFGIGTALTIAWIGWQLAGPAAALIGGLIWSLAPIVVDLNSLAIPDPLLYLTCALAVATAIAAWQRRSMRFLALSLLCGIAAIYLKLWVFTAVLPFVLVSLALLRRDWRAYLPRIALLYAAAGVSALYFILVLNPLANTRKIRDFASDGGFFAQLLDSDRLLNNLWHIAYPVDAGSGLALLVLALGAAAYVYSRRRGWLTPDRFSVVLVTVYVLSTWWLSAGISNVNIDYNGRMRHIYPVVVAFLPLWSAALVQLTGVVARLLDARRRGLGRLAWSGAVALMALLVVGYTAGVAELVDTYNRPHSASLILDWFDGSPPRDGLVLLPADSTYNALWNRLWGAYVGSKPYDWWLTPIDEIAASAPDAYVERGIRWLVLSDLDLETARDRAQIERYLDSLLLVKQVRAMAGQGEGRELSVYRFELPDQRVEVAFGGQIGLIGYDLSETTVSAGTTLRIRPYWSLLAPTTQNLSMFVHLYSADAVEAGAPVPLAQWDGEPLTNGSRPTSTWSDLSEVYFGEDFALTVPADAAPGEYLLAIGLYDLGTQTRLTLPDRRDSFAIRLTVTASESVD